MRPALDAIRHAARRLRRRPLFTALAVTTVGLGVGGATAMFSVVDGILVRDLPYRDADRVVDIWKAWPSWRDDPSLAYVWDHIQLPWEEYLRVRAAAPGLTEVAAFRSADKVLFDRGTPRTVTVGYGSANLFGMLGVAPERGRGFSSGEVAPDGAPAPVALLSHELWATAFGSDPAVVGGRLRLDGDVYTVVGVLPEGFRLTSDLRTVHDNAGAADAGLRDVWLPLGTDGVDCGNCFELMGRLAPGATPQQVAAGVQPLLGDRPADQIARVAFRKARLTRGLAPPLLMLFGAAGILLTLACVNVAGLFLGEAVGRADDLAVRSALGASRRRLWGTLVAESALVGVLGGALGVAVAVAGTGSLLTLAPPLPRLEEVGVDVRALAFALGVGVGTGILFGLAPAWSGTRGVGRAGLRTRGGSRPGRRMHQGLVALQVALTTVLLAAGALFQRSFASVLSVDPGFDVDGLVALDVPTPVSGDVPPDRRLSALTAALAAVPGVRAVSAVSMLPFPGARGSTSFAYERGGERTTSTQWFRAAAPGYLEMMGIPLLAGRTLSDADGAEAEPAMVVSRALADRNWPDGDAIGSRVDYNGREWRIVGVVGDVRQRALGAPVEPTFYVPHAQRPGQDMTYVVRVAGEAGALTDALRRAVWTVDPDGSIEAGGPVTERMEASEADERFRAVLLTVFAGLAASLAAVGMFGVTFRGARARTAELAIRSAIGARPADLVALVTRDGLAGAAAGAAAGLAGAYWVGGLVASLLYGIDGRDPVSFGVAVAGLVAVTLVATVLPAMRIVGRGRPADALASDAK